MFAASNPDEPARQQIYLGARRAGKTALLNSLFQPSTLKGTTLSKTPDKSELQRNLEALADRMNDHIKQNEPIKMDLLSPGVLTVHVNGAGYKKINHVGGETFALSGVRVGAASKGCRMIFEFKPDQAASYASMEMDEQEAMSKLDNFRPAINAAADGNYVAEVQAIRASERKEQVALEAQARAADYDNFGSW